jgi:hypothetical protein
MLEMSHLFLWSVALLNMFFEACVRTLCVIISMFKDVGDMVGGHGRHTSDMIHGTLSVNKYVYMFLCYFCSNYNAYLMELTSRIAQLRQ